MFGDKIPDCLPCYLLTHPSPRLFFDKRDESGFDLLTVNETANDLPGGEGGNNSINKLSLEATFINQNFSQQCLKRESKTFKRPNPFINEDDEGEPSSVAYRSVELLYFLFHFMLVLCLFTNVMLLFILFKTFFIQLCLF